MGTRSLTIFVDKGFFATDPEAKPEKIAVMYRQFDGYPSGHGRDLAEFLSGFEVGNGIAFGRPGKFANGADCLFAQIVAHFKTEPGDIYLVSPKTKDAGQEYEYTVQAGYNLPIRLIIRDVYEKRVVFDGSPEQFLESGLAND